MNWSMERSSRPSVERREAAETEPRNGMEAEMEKARDIFCLQMISFFLRDNFFLLNPFSL
ncbi:hypothetical protein PMAYCL1PPCAC_28465 [Pristionchus mayeri]|uniref:Uncharacterized protein n=1 Tax=Pristionchus mayeri TaxID=1317129 RepID=A0AAN5D9V2_9BILA|nr:hypothetical protein PMAYCL1PPCAC_28465 [Pristionchus mayeri]